MDLVLPEEFYGAEKSVITWMADYLPLTEAPYRLGQQRRFFADFINRCENEEAEFGTETGDQAAVEMCNFL